MNSQELTAQQRAVFRWVKEFIREKGWPPTRKEIATQFGFASPNAAECHLRALHRKGALRVGAGGARRIAVNDAYQGRA